MPDGPAESVRGRRILVVEDEYLIARYLQHTLEGMGAVVLGPAATAEAALALIEAEERIDGATLDLKLGGVKSFAVAEALLARNVPFVLLTGYGEPALPDHLSGVPRCVKPVDTGEVVRALFG